MVTSNEGTSLDSQAHSQLWIFSVAEAAWAEFQLN